MYRVKGHDIWLGTDTERTTTPGFRVGDEFVVISSGSRYVMAASGWLAAGGGGGAADVEDLTTDNASGLEYVRAKAGADGLEYRTPGQVLSDIGAAAAGDLTAHAGNTSNPHSVTAAQVGAVALAGDTMTGALTIASTGAVAIFGDGTGIATAAIDGAAGQVRVLRLLTAGSSRWFIRANATAESGSNAGSDLEILARTDAGTALSTPLTITRSTGHVGIGTGTPQTPLHVVATGIPARFERSNSGVVENNTFYNPDTTDDNGTLLVFSTDTTGAGATTNLAMAVVGAIVSTHDHATSTAQLVFRTRVAGAGLATNRVTIGTGVQVGSPTGGDKGAGTINAAGDIYKANSAYINPDFALEHWATGYIERFADRPGAAAYPGLLPLEKLSGYLRQHLHLPGRADGPMGIFQRSDLAQQWLEELAIYITQLHERVKELEHGNT